MGQKVSYPKDKHIVVVGGGFAGIELCLRLMDNGANFTLIDSRDAFHFNVASVRTIVAPELAEQVLLPYIKTFGDNFQQGKMVGVDPSSRTVKLEDGTNVNYDILVLAVGTTGHFPSKMGHINRSEAINMYKDYSQKLHGSTNIVIVGGGAVGVEIAGEIATDCPDKKVTLIHGMQELVRPDLTEGFRKKVQKTLTSLGVNVIIGELVNDLDSYDGKLPCDVTTDKGTSIPADIIITTTGLTVNKLAYMDGLGHYVDERDAIRVSNTFQVDDHDDIFAMGDCCASGDPWMAYLAAEHAKVVASNISKKFSGEPLGTYKNNSSPAKLVLTVGRNYSFGELKNGWPIPQMVCQKLKGDLMVARFHGIMRQKP